MQTDVMYAAPVTVQFQTLEGHCPPLCTCDYPLSPSSARHVSHGAASLRDMSFESLRSTQIVVMDAWCRLEHRDLGLCSEICLADPVTSACA